MLSETALKNNTTTMKRHHIGVLIGVVIGGNILINTITYSGAFDPIVYAREPELPQVVQIEVKIDWTRERIEREIDEQAAKYGVSAALMRTIINCESQYTINARGDNNHSRGLVQIHDFYHPEVTDDMADDPKFAIAFLAEHLAAGSGHLWSCHP